jgi:predicted small secreted protein
MKKRGVLILGLPAALLAFSMVLTSCPDPNGGGGH